MDEFEKKINDDDISETSSVSENEDSDNEDMIFQTSRIEWPWPVPRFSVNGKLLLIR